MESFIMKSQWIAIVGIGLMCSNIYALDTQTTQSATIGNKIQMKSTQEQNQTQGDAFLSANKNKSGVVTLADGLQYKIIVDGNGAKPTLTDSVMVHYSGTLIDGTEFDSSYKRGAPATFPVNAVIAGWTEALQLMTVGSTWELYIPSTLAYGSMGAPPAIGPNQTLIFKVELLGIKK